MKKEQCESHDTRFLSQQRLETILYHKICFMTTYFCWTWMDCPISKCLYRIYSIKLIIILVNFANKVKKIIILARMIKLDSYFEWLRFLDHSMALKSIVILIINLFLFSMFSPNRQQTWTLSFDQKS